MRGQLDYFADCIRNGHPPQIGGGAQARQALEIALASKASCETAQPIALSFHSP
jgi:predicted dehydrogenase